MLIFYVLWLAYNFDVQGCACVLHPVQALAKGWESFWLQVRADLNVPLDKDLNITDDTRIRAAIPTLKYLTDNGAKVLLTSHLVRFFSCLAVPFSVP